MSLKNQITSQWNQLPQGQAHRLELTEGDKRLVCQFESIESIGCHAEELSLETPALASVEMDDLRKVSEKLSAQLSYLMEPIRPIEFDEECCTVQMRSNPPQKDETGTTYFELTVERGGKLTLRRWQKSKGSPRSALSMALTKEVLARVVGDFENAV